MPCSCNNPCISGQAEALDAFSALAELASLADDPEQASAPAAQQHAEAVGQAEESVAAANARLQQTQATEAESAEQAQKETEVHSLALNMRLAVDSAWSSCWCSCQTRPAGTGRLPSHSALLLMRGSPGRPDPALRHREGKACPYEQGPWELAECS